MGAWGAGNFENDEAADWVIDLLEGGSEEDVRAALRRAVDADEPETPDGTQGLAAAEVVAAAAGRPIDASEDSSAEDAARWGASHPGLADEATLQLARRAVEAIADVETSELAMLWAETTGDDSLPPDWVSALDDLRRRLTG